MQIGVKSPRKYNLLEIFAQITEPASSSQFCTESRGTCKLCLLSTTWFTVFIPIVFECFSCVFRLCSTLSHNVFVIDIIFKLKKSFRLFTTEER